jgi:hypothetical protein
MKTTASLIAGLPAALELPPEAITDTMRHTVQQLDEAARIADKKREAEWRATFRPCAYLLGTETRPTQITIYGMTGGSERWLKIPIDISRPVVTFASQAFAVGKSDAGRAIFWEDHRLHRQLHTRFRGTV